jgi:hypothetical protein
MRPDDDLLRDLAAEGFESPLLFRTAAQYWVDHASRNGDANPPPGEQFRDLVQWLELGLSRIEIEAVKARGVGQLLEQCSQALESVNPPEVSSAAEKTAAAWEPILDDESEAFSDVMLTTLDPNQQEIEQHFRVEGQRRFRGILAWYLSLINRFQYVGARFRSRVPFVGGAEPQRAAVNLAGFTHECVRRASERSLDRRHESLAHKLLVEADDHGFPPDLLPGPVGDVSKRNWREQFESNLNDALSAVEQQWIRPSGPKAWMQMTLIWFCNYLPELTLVASIIVLFWGVFYEKTMPTMFMAFSPFFLTLLVLVLLQIIINFVMPLRWPSIRGKFRKELVRQLRSSLHEAYLPVPAAVAESLKTERKRIADIRAEVDDVARYLDQHQRASSVQGLYGS